jgi:hypothetical protein
MRSRLHAHNRRLGSMRMPDERDTGAALGRCGGYVVEADDGVVGMVVTPLFPRQGGDPDFLVVQVHDPARPRTPIVPAALVEEVDRNFRIVRVRGRREQVSHLPEHLPRAT